MPAKKDSGNTNGGTSPAGVSSSVEELLLASLERGDGLETGRYIMTFKEDADEEAVKSFGDQGRGMRVADARDFDKEAVSFENMGDSDVIVFPEVGAALIGGNAAQEFETSAFSEMTADNPIQAIEPEHFVFADNIFGVSEVYMPQGTFGDTGENGSSNGPLQSAARILEAIAKEVPYSPQQKTVFEIEEEPLVLGATWGLHACRVPASTRSGLGIKVAILDTGFDIVGTGHPDFAGRPIVSNQFVGQPVQDLNGHGTHCTGTSTGPRTPPGVTPRYGIGYQSRIFIGKVLTNGGGGTSATVLAGMNWAIANRCEVISMSLGGSGGPFAYYTEAGRRALNNGLLIIAAAGNSGPTGSTGSPANSPTIFSVASLDANLRPSSFSSRGKIEIAAPGRDVFSSFPRPTRYRTMSGTSMACPHVSGCAALWAQTSPNLRGVALANRLLTTARPLPFPITQVGRGLVQAPA